MAVLQKVVFAPYEIGGKIAGIELKELKDPVFRELGVQPGDVIQHVNGMRITDIDSAMRVYQRYNNARLVRVGILRNGKPMSLVFRLK